MTFSYSGNPSSSNLDLVRFLLWDTDSTDVLVTNEEIQYMLTTWQNPYEAARACAERLSAKFVRMADQITKSVGDISISKSYSAKADQYVKLSDEIAEQRARLFPATPIVNSNSLKSSRERTYDTRKSDFYVGIDDNRGS
jgi:hypothetical protein